MACVWRRREEPWCDGAFSRKLAELQTHHHPLCMLFPQHVDLRRYRAGQGGQRGTPCCADNHGHPGDKQSKQPSRG